MRQTRVGRKQEREMGDLKSVGVDMYLEIGPPKSEILDLFFLALMGRIRIKNENLVSMEMARFDYNREP